MDQGIPFYPTVDLTNITDQREREIRSHAGAIGFPFHWQAYQTPDIIRHARAMGYWQPLEPEEYTWKSPRFTAPSSLDTGWPEFITVQHEVPYYDNVVSYGRGPNSIISLSLGAARDLQDSLGSNTYTTMTYPMVYATIKRMLEANLAAARAELNSWSVSHSAMEVVNDATMADGFTLMDKALESTHDAADYGAILVHQGPNYEERCLTCVAIGKVTYRPSRMI